MISVVHAARLWPGRRSFTSEIKLLRRVCVLKNHMKSVQNEYSQRAFDARVSRFSYGLLGRVHKMTVRKAANTSTKVKIGLKNEPASLSVGFVRAFVARTTCVLIQALCVIRKSSLQCPCDHTSIARSPYVVSTPHARCKHVHVREGHVQLTQHVRIVRCT